MFFERETYLVRDYGVICVHTWSPPFVEAGMQAHNWLFWAGFLKGLEKLGQRADRKLA